MPSRPRIAIPLGLDEGPLRRGRVTAYLDGAYPDAVARAGGVPILVPMAAGAEDALEGIDGLLLPGGDDFPAPHPYPDDVAFNPAPAPQRAFDCELLTLARSRRLPILGICYGMQLIALQAEGSLHYDLASDRPGGLVHTSDNAEDRHMIQVEDDSRLATILGAGRHEVNSRHHQAIDAPGHDLRVAARAEDGLIEAIETLGDDFLIGVQWHPEDLDDPASTALFRALVSACAAEPASA
jgi:putative glutamine amidotransferase